MAVDAARTRNVLQILHIISRSDAVGNTVGQSARSRRWNNCCMVMAVTQPSYASRARVSQELHWAYILQ